MSDQINQTHKRAWSDWPGWPYLIVGLAALLRIIHILNSRSNPTFWAPAIDPGWYDQTAQNIVMGNWGPFPLFRAPLYTTLLAGVYAVFGHDLVAARLLNVLFQGVAVWAVWRMGRTYFTPAVGIIAALLLCVNGTAIYFAGELVSTSAEMMMAALGLWSTLRLIRDPGPTAITICGLTWGFAAITRPNFLFVYPAVLLAVVLLSRIPKALFSRQTWISIAIWSASAFIPILPVTAVNYIYGGEFVLIATQGGVNFWIGNNPESTGILSVLPGYGNTWTMDDAESDAERDVGRPLKSGELSNYYYAKGWDFLKAHPGPAIRFMIRKTALFFNRFEISNNKHIEHFAGLSPWLPFLIKLNFGILVPLGLLGFWIDRKQTSVRIILGLLICYTISVVLFFITARFRMPVVPWLVLPAASGLVWIYGFFRRQPRRHPLYPLLLLIPGLAIAYINLWNLAEAPIGWARYMEGNAFIRLSQLDSAKVCFFDSIRDSNAVARSKLNLGVIAQREGNNTEALHWYQEALKADSHIAEIWNNLGTVQEASGDTLQALASYQKARALRPSAPDPRHNLAGVHFRLGNSAFKQKQDSLALRHFQECIALEPSPPAFHNLALAYVALGDMPHALASVERALQFDPYYTPAQKLRARLVSGSEATPTAGSAPAERD